MQAVWSSTDEINERYPALNGDIHVDIAIVGGGITGLSCAYALSRRGKKVAVFEALQIGKGTTGSSTGNLYAPIDERLFSVESKHNLKVLEAVVQSRLAAINFIEDRIKEFDIDCDFQRVPFHLFAEPGDGTSGQVAREFGAAEKTGLQVTDVVPNRFPFKVEAITSISDQAQLNPLKYVRALAKAIENENCRIYENTQVLEANDGNPCVLKTSGGTVTSQKVIMATHTPKGIYAVHTAMEPYREYALTARLKGEAPESGIYWNAKQNQQYSVRPYRNGSGHFLLVLGEPHKVGHQRNNQEAFRKLEQYLEERFDVERIEFMWAAQNYKPADNLPYIGTSLTQTHTYIATGFAADGLVWGTVAASIISDLIEEKENAWAPVFDPKRFTPAASAKKFVKENISVSKHLLKDFLFYGEAEKVSEIKNGEGKTLVIDNEKVAVYRNDQGKLSIVSSICPHMGCIVHWNDAEKTWDCPCHGSRFGVEGEVLEGPAFHNLSKPKAQKK